MRPPAEQRDRIRRAVKAMPRQDKLVLIMHYGDGDGLTDAEMGRVLGLPGELVAGMRERILGELKDVAGATEHARRTDR